MNILSLLNVVEAAILVGQKDKTEFRGASLSPNLPCYSTRSSLFSALRVTNSVGGRAVDYEFQESYFLSLKYWS